MDIEDLDIDINVEINSISDLKKVRKELQKIAKARKEIEVAEDDNTSDDQEIPDIGDDYPGPNPSDPRFPEWRGPKQDKWVVKDDEGGQFDTRLETSEDELRLTSNSGLKRY